MMDERVSLDKLIEYFISDSQDDESTDNDSGNSTASLASKNNYIITTYAKDKIREDVVNEIKSEVRQSIIEEYENENQKNSTLYILKLIIETFLIACLVGLMVNQFTDLINITKGQDTNITVTLIWIAGFFGGLLIIFLIEIAINKIRKFIKSH